MGRQPQVLILKGLIDRKERCQPMQKCTTNELNFTTVNRKKVVAVFDDPQVTSDASVG